MATTSPSPRIRRIQSRRKSPAYEFPPIFDEFRGSTMVDGTQAAPCLRRRRSRSERRLSQARSPSRSQQQASLGVSDALSNFGNGLGVLFSDFLWPLSVWLLVLGSVILNLITLVSVVSVIAENNNQTTDTTDLPSLESWAPSWVTELSWHFRHDDAHTISTDDPAGAILGDYTAIGASSGFKLPSAQIDLATNATEQTKLVIRRALHQVEKMKITSLNRKEVASLAREWDEKRKKSDEAFQSLLSEESAFRRNMLVTVRLLASFIAQHEDELANPSAWGQLYAWAPFMFPQEWQPPAAIITQDIKRFARQQATEADKLANTARDVRNAVRQESDVRENLKIMLPINLKELGEDVDLDELQKFLQHGSEVWIQNALEVADTFRKRYRQLSEQYLEISRIVREKSGNWRDRAALADLIQANMAGFKQSLAESEHRLAAMSNDEQMSVG